MRASSTLTCCALLLGACLQTLSAQTGSTGMSFLKSGSGARSIGMGDAGVASSLSGESIYYNPARMSALGMSSLTAMYQKYIQDITSSQVSGVAALDGWSLGVHMALSTVRDIEVRDVPGVPIGRFDTQNFSGGLSAATALGRGMHAGVTVKYLYEKIYVDDAGGVAADFGLAWNPGEPSVLVPSGIGVSLSNVGSMSALRSTATVLPLLLRYGAAWDIPVEAIHGGVHVEADGLALLREDTHHLHLGIEMDYEQSIFLRAGYQSGYEVRDFSAGFGAAYAQLRIDYAMIPFSDNFGTAHTFSLSLQL